MFNLDMGLIQEQAIASYPNEAVWLITEKDGCYQVDNVHEDPQEYFRVSAGDSLTATRNGLLAVLHSHCDGHPVPSAADISLREKLGVPCGILNTDGATISEITWMSDAIAPLEGRTFAHGTSDCFSIVKDYYSLQGIKLADVPRDWMWWENGQNLLDELFESRGFREVPSSEAKEGDVWFAQVRGPVIHHCGILLANDLILHHPGAGEPIDHSKLSIKEPIYRYLPYIKKFLRYEGSR